MPSIILHIVLRHEVVHHRSASFRSSTSNPATEFNYLVEVVQNSLITYLDGYALDGNNVSWLVLRAVLTSKI
ncbi:uncharacterized protein Bfra_008705 [Botrytis fragariae]|uniref:Uncharacterized protein n=1 Tax=Botrytis fragariae TaxID=1964551 RepID=A0A8H6EGV9_9HELO|nr:uncharacterized protein Bfra_008705 [Botrytis fragariae]KAF5871681.1 hypothetical protein Bfra_008705 [Botrytis fragariae]